MEGKAHRPPQAAQKEQGAAPEASPGDGTSSWGLDIAAMAGSLVHEIKNPLSTLKINAQLLIEDWRGGTEPRQIRTVRRLRTMLAELKRLEDVIHSFLSFTRHYDLRLERVSVNDILTHIIELVQEAAEKKGIRVRRGLDPELPPTQADRSLLEQAFMNLVANAQDAMPDGGELIVKSRREDTWIVVDIIDTGAGIPPHQLGRIFDLYFSTKQGGSGLGLARCRRIVYEHGGHIDVRSEVGRGSQFTVKLPIRGES